MSNLIKASEFGLDEKKGLSIEKEFAVVTTEQSGLIEVYNQILKAELNKETEEDARKLSIKLSKLNASNNKIHKTQKAFYLAGGKFVDALKNKNRDIIDEMQARLEEIKNYSRNLRLAEIAKLKAEREGKLLAFNSMVIPEGLGEMDADVWANYLIGIEAAYNAAQEAEKKAEEERLAKIEADRLEQIRVRKENEKLKAEAVERERIAKIEQAKRDKERKEREAKEAKKQAALDAQLKKEREERKRIANVLKAKEAASAKAKADEAARIEAELNKGDAAKVKDLIADLEALKTKYSFKSSKNKKKYADVGILIEKVINHINK